MRFPFVQSISVSSISYFSKQKQRICAVSIQIRISYSISRLSVSRALCHSLTQSPRTLIANDILKCQLLRRTKNNGVSDSLHTRSSTYLCVFDSHSTNTIAIFTFENRRHSIEVRCCHRIRIDQTVLCVLSRCLALVAHTGVISVCACVCLCVRAFD